MASAQVLLSPAELAYLHTSLSLSPPIRPDGRKPQQFRPLTAETGILPGTNGSARVCFADGTEAIVGVKAEIEKTSDPLATEQPDDQRPRHGQMKGGQEDEAGERVGRNEWLEITVEIPGYRDDEANTVFLASMLSEAIVADRGFTKKLLVNTRFHWKLYVDILLISPPLSYPLPLLSLTTHLALLATRLPLLKSEGDEDPMFDDDWHASTYIYPRADTSGSRPPITLLVISVGTNIIFDPSKEELAIAEVVLAVSVSEAAKTTGSGRDLRLHSIRTVDPPSRLTPPGVPNSDNPTVGIGITPKKMSVKTDVNQAVQGLWKAPLGGAKFAMLQRMIAAVLEKGGVADEVLDGLEGVELT